MKPDIEPKEASSEQAERTLATRTARELDFNELCEIAGGATCSTILSPGDQCDDWAQP
ncbi:hypothetical protein [Sphingobium sp. TCM1]|uniref:hypothetical protein n=1 Tax=Sphingobium sp. TCM1 TaxID=453246 RepID=UPI000B009945|nr:hypothetical protein [Sphingobium sp. TCM1]